MAQLLWYDLTKTGGLSAGAEYNFSPYETDAHTLYEIVGIQTDYEDGVVKVVVNGQEVPHLAINANLIKEGYSFTADSGGSATSYLFKKYGFFMIGKPITFAQRFYGYPYEYTSIKVGPRSQWYIKLFGLNDTSNDIHVRVLVVRLYDNELPKLFPGGFDFSFVVSDPETGDMVHFTKSFPTISVGNWTKLPGGMDQDEPKLFRFSTYASGSSTTTANTPYRFEYPDFVSYSWQDMWWNLDAREAYILDKVGFSGADKFRIYVETHKRNDWLTMPILESTSGTNADIIEPFVTDIPPMLIHNTQGGLEVLSTSGGTTPVGALAGYYVKLH